MAIFEQSPENGCQKIKDIFLWFGNNYDFRGEYIV